MSFDLGVWHSDAPMSVEQARSYYAHINSDWVGPSPPAGVRRFPHDAADRAFPTRVAPTLGRPTPMNRRGG